MIFGAYSTLALIFSIVSIVINIFIQSDKDLEPKKKDRIGGFLRAALPITLITLGLMIDNI